ncbi:fasciclin domain-containing protein [Mucilaginibacter sp. RS28]|uniref:Fasciclin domain-containing protein n=1 Tax=Mucilaginibacter straminoryzae TaxID=2932774 RepID=A0A9X1X7M0_9SPHI|nr:fasciclin domain-containing protein [Mucilaginibacter straminoryzae]MCJ8211168.1 fasciclin domain-containing protein [Mucilaginibacter straminoryzae]
MKKLLLIFLTLLFANTMFAQRIAIPTTPVTDSIKARRLSKNEMKEVDGIKMGTGWDVVENVHRAPKFTILFDALRASGLIATFKSRGPFTVFAPDNTAFEAMPNGRLDTLMKKAHQLELTCILAGHAVPGSLNIKQLAKKINSNKGAYKLTTLAGTKLTAKLDNEDVVLIDELGNEGKITTADIKQSNGLIHVITKVLLPKNNAI